MTIKTEAKQTYLVAAILSKVLGLFAKSRKGSSLFLSVSSNSVPTTRIFIQFYTGNIFKNLSRKI